MVGSWLHPNCARYVVLWWWFEVAGSMLTQRSDCRRSQSGCAPHGTRHTPIRGTAISCGVEAESEITVGQTQDSGRLTSLPRLPSHRLQSHIIRRRGRPTARSYLLIHCSVTHLPPSPHWIRLWKRPGIPVDHALPCSGIPQVAWGALPAPGAVLDRCLCSYRLGRLSQSPAFQLRYRFHTPTR